MKHETTLSCSALGIVPVCPSDQRPVLCYGKRLNIAGSCGREIGSHPSISCFSRNRAKIKKVVRIFLISLLYCLSTEVH